MGVDVRPGEGLAVAAKCTQGASCELSLVDGLLRAMLGVVVQGTGEGKIATRTRQKLTWALLLVVDPLAHGEGLTTSIESAQDDLMLAKNFVAEGVGGGTAPSTTVIQTSLC